MFLLVGLGFAFIASGIVAGDNNTHDQLKLKDRVERKADLFERMRSARPMAMYQALQEDLPATKGVCEKTNGNEELCYSFLHQLYWPSDTAREDNFALCMDWMKEHKKDILESWQACHLFTTKSKVDYIYMHMNAILKENTQN
jgi:hypothetical protein